MKLDVIVTLTATDRLKRTEVDLDRLGLAFFGDPAQLEPICGKSIWSTMPPKGNMEKSATQASLKGRDDFRVIMGMPLLKDIPLFEKWMELIQKIEKKKKLSEAEIIEKRKLDEKVGRHLYDGNYQAVYLDECKRSDNTEEAIKFAQLNKRVRYGEYTDIDLKELKSMNPKQECFTTHTYCFLFSFIGSFIAPRALVLDFQIQIKAYCLNASENVKSVKFEI